MSGKPEKPALVVDPGHVSLRDYFAASALSGILAGADGNMQSDALAENCYLAADAMLKARGGK
jgi:hypothetical protein